MEWVGTVALLAIFTLAAVIAGRVDDEPRASLEMKRALARNGYHPLI